MARAQTQDADKAKATQTKKAAKAAKKPRVYVGGSARYAVLIGVVILLALSLIMAFSASSGEAVINQVSKGAAELAKQGLDPALSHLSVRPFTNGIKQLLFIVGGLLAAVFIARFDYHHFEKPARLLSWILFAALLVLLVIGERILGSSRWYNLGLFSLQPSEFAKPVLLVLLASFCAGRTDTNRRGFRGANKTPRDRESLTTALLVAGSLIFILLEPDFGTTLIIFIGLSAAYILCDWPWYGPAVVVVVATPILALRVLLSKGYQSGRISAFLDKWTKGITAHQTLQAEYALGSGGLSGLGPGLSRQKFRYLPEAQNDFIIAIIGEELGLLGTLLTLFGFALILFGGIWIASRAKDRLGRALAGGATIMLVFQAVLNIFAVVSLGPVTGKPLPFITLGGSSMISSLLLIGLIFSVAKHGNTKTKASLSMAADAAPRVGRKAGSPTSPKPSTDTPKRTPAKKPASTRRQPPDDPPTPSSSDDHPPLRLRMDRKRRNSFDDGSSS